MVGSSYLTSLHQESFACERDVLVCVVDKSDELLLANSFFELTKHVALLFTLPNSFLELSMLRFDVPVHINGLKLWGLIQHFEELVHADCKGLLLLLLLVIIAGVQEEVSGSGIKLLKLVKSGPPPKASLLFAS